MVISNSNLKLSLHSTRGAFGKRNLFLVSPDIKFCSAAPGYFITKKMQNNNFPLAIGATGTFSLTSNARKASTPPVYEIEDTKIDGYSVFVDLIINGKPSFKCIAIADLSQFVIKTGMNEWVIDSMYCGDHCQDAGSFDAETFIHENLTEVLTAYLMEGAAS